MKETVRTQKAFPVPPLPASGGVRAHSARQNQGDGEIAAAKPGVGTDLSPTKAQKGHALSTWNNAAHGRTVRCRIGVMGNGLYGSSETTVPPDDQLAGREPEAL